MSLIRYLLTRLILTQPANYRIRGESRSPKLKRQFGPVPVRFKPYSALLPPAFQLDHDRSCSGTAQTSHLWHEQRIQTLQIDIRIPEADSLKGKRLVLKGLKIRIRNKFNVSISEIDKKDSWQSALIAVATIGDDKRFLNQVLDKVVDLCRDVNQLEIIDYQLEFI